MDSELLVKSIRELCKKNNIAISQLENELHFSAGLISRWVKNYPSIDKIVDIAYYFHVSLDEVVGYNNNLDDEFISKLYNQTNRKEIIWNKVTKDMPSYPKIKLYNSLEDEPHQFYDEENYGEIHYATKYNNGYIIIYAFYRYSYLLKPRILKLFIQPTIDSYLVEQEYHQNTLLTLWIQILKNLDDNIPDEVKAEEFKNSFINTPNNLNNEKINEFLEDPSIAKLIETVDIKEFQKVQQIFEDPKFKSALQMLNNMQNYLDNKNK